MVDKSWMLNPQAIRHAKTCIQIVKDRTNQKLKLSQTDFFQQLEDCKNKIHSVEFIAAHHKLMSMAENTALASPDGLGNSAFFRKKASAVTGQIKAVDSVETVACGGRH